MLILSCFKLHNFCHWADEEASVARYPSGQDGQGVRARFEQSTLEGYGHPERQSDSERSSLRFRMTARVEQLGRRRPHTTRMYEGRGKNRAWPCAQRRDCRAARHEQEGPHTTRLAEETKEQAAAGGRLGGA